MNIILIISDTFRRDHLPAYGNETVITPNFDRFAAQSLIFEDAWISSFPTVPARSDIFTGRITFPFFGWGPLPSEIPTLAEAFSDAGHRTFGVADTPFLVRNGYGHDRGFDDFVQIRGQRHGPERWDYEKRRHKEADYFAPMTFQTGMDWLERNYESPFFLLLDTWDPHEPWDPPPYYVRPYFDAYQGEQINPVYWEYQEAGLKKQDVEIAHACYCGEISMIDSWFGRLMEKVRVLGLEENTAILFTSDHGFYFGEHGLFGKRRFKWPGDIPFYTGFEKGMQQSQGYIYHSPLHQELTRVPFLLRLPELSPKRISGLVTLPDIMPTLLEISGLPIPESVQAKSVLPLIQGQSEQIHEVVVSSAPFEKVGDITKTVDDLERQAREVSPSTITDGQFDLLFGNTNTPASLYDSRQDPGHQKNILDEKPEIARKLHRKFVAWMEALSVPETVIAPRRDPGF